MYTFRNNLWNSYTWRHSLRKCDSYVLSETKDKAISILSNMLNFSQIALHYSLMHPSFIKELLNTWCMLNTMLGSRNTIKAIPCLTSHSIIYQKYVVLAKENCMVRQLKEGTLVCIAKKQNLRSQEEIQQLENKSKWGWSN